MRVTRIGTAVLAGALLSAAVAWAQKAPETFVATASVKKGSVSASAPVRVSITRYGAPSERDVVLKAIRQGGAAALRKALSGFTDAGFIELGERRTTVKFASARPTSGGQLITALTAEPILFLGAGIPAAKPTTGFDVAVAMLEVKDGGGVGVGDLTPAAKVGLDEGGALLIEDYGATVIWLNGIARGR